MPNHPHSIVAKKGMIIYWLSEHPAIVSFRWNHAQTWGSTWSFLISSLTLYVAAALFLQTALYLLGRRRPVPLGLIPTIHSLVMVLVSTVIFLGMLFSLVAEIGETRWLWRRSKTTPLQWLLCFPLGTRPLGRVFFWSYAFYLSRFLHLLRTFVSVLRRRRHTIRRVFSHSALVCMSFLWLEFSQSLQIVAILSATVAQVVLFGYRFWVGVGLHRGSSSVSCFPIVMGCQLALLGSNLLCHLGVLLLHFWKEGCNGIGAWVFNSILNVAFLLFFLNCYAKRAVRRRKGLPRLEDDCGSIHYRPELKLEKEQ